MPAQLSSPSPSARQTFRWVAASACVLSAATRAVAQAPSPADTFTIDTRSKPAAVLSAGARRFQVDQRIRIVATNVNPFRYQVRIRAVPTVVREPAIIEFLKLLTGLTSIPGTTETDAAPADKSYALIQELKFDVGVARACTGDALERVKRYQTETQQASKLAVEAIKQVGSVAARIDKLQARVKLLTDSLRMDIDATDAIRIGKMLSQLIETDAGQESAVLVKSETLRWTADSLVAARMARSEEVLRASLACASEVSAIVGLLSEQAPRLATAKGTTAIASRTLEAVQVIGRTVAAIVDDPTNFIVVATIGGFARSTNVTVHVERRTAGTDVAWTEITSEQFVFGAGPRFGLGFGIAWNRIVSRAYEVQRAYTTPSVPNGADSVRTVIGVKDEMRGRVSPMVMLDVELLPDGARASAPRWLRNARGLFGVSYVIKEKRLAFENLEYLLGAGLTLAEDRVLVGGGMYLGAQLSLPESLRVGQPVPLAQTTVPTVSRLVGVPTVFVSLRFL